MLTASNSSPLQREKVNMKYQSAVMTPPAKKKDADEKKPKGLGYKLAMMGRGGK